VFARGIWTALMKCVVLHETVSMQAYQWSRGLAVFARGTALMKCVVLHETVSMQAYQWSRGLAVFAREIGLF